MRVILAIVTLLFTLQGVSNSKSLTEAQTVDEMIEIEAKNYKIRQNREACQYEADNENFPEHCLELLDLYLEDVSESAEAKSLMIKVDQLCQKTARNLRSHLRIEEILRNKPVSSHCENALKLRLQDLKYIQSL